MLYHILYLFRDRVDGLNVIRYVTFRSMAAFFVALLVVLIFQPVFIRWFRSRQIGQPIRDDGPQSHLSKQGTPTMGGLVIVLAVLLGTLLFADLTNVYVWATMLVTFVFGALGFVDDYQKIRYKNSKGLTARQKLVCQFGAAFVVMLLLKFAGFPTTLTFPFLKGATVDLGWFFVPFGLLVIVGASNAVNLTDGLDGLVIGPTITVAMAYGIFVYVAGHAKISEYLQIPHVAGASELAIFAAAIVAAGLGFLWYNSFPAQVFMGDVGALALGAALGMLAVISKQELVLIVAGGIFVVEALSVLMQVGYFKLTRKRIFRMAPLHHHFELSGLSEPKIIVRFWIISLVLAVISLTTLKLR
jgi:phospho-N-acetylmuramoyl-pentapeptide-transferase